jgi:hypothetical protein
MILPESFFMAYENLQHKSCGKYGAFADGHDDPTWWR